MKHVSAEFKRAIKDDDRKVILQAEFEFVDPTAKPDATQLVSGNAAISKPEQLLDSDRDNFIKLASFEKDYLKLDGSFVLPPEPTEESSTQIGWWSDVISNASGIFNNNPVLVLTWPSIISVAGLTLTFPKNEIPIDIDIKSYADITHLKTVEVRGNKLDRLWIENNFDNFNKLEIIFTKTNANRRIRLLEVDFGHVLIFDNKSIIKASIVEQNDSANLVSPTNELSLEVLNKDYRYSFGNPNGYYHALQKSQIFSCRWGVIISPGNFEFVDGGRYYLDTWGLNKGLTARFTAYDVLNSLDQKLYSKGGVLTVAKRTQTLKELAVDILNDAAIENYQLDPCLETISTQGFLSVMSHREALQTVAIASNCVLDADRNNVIQILKQSSEPIDEVIKKSQQWVVPRTLLEKQSEVIETEVYKYVDSSNSDSLYSHVLNMSGTTEIFATYEKPALNVDINITGGTLVEVNKYVNGAKLKINANDEVTINITGKPLVISKSIVSTNALKTANVTVKNPLVTTDNMANSINTYIKNYYAQRLILDIDNTGNPALETGDIITVVDDFGTEKQARITKQELTYNGTLRVKTTTRGSM